MGTLSVLDRHPGRRPVNANDNHGVRLNPYESTALPTRKKDCMMIAQINHDRNYLVENGPVQPLPRYHDYEERQVLFVPYSIDAPTLHELIVHTLAGEYVLFSYDGYVIQLKREKDTGKETL